MVVAKLLKEEAVKDDKLLCDRIVDLHGNIRDLKEVRQNLLDWVGKL